MKNLFSVLLIVVVAYSVACGFLYAFQEKLLFFPEQLSSDYAFLFPYPFAELNYEVEDGVVLNSVLFSTKNSRGVVYYLHGNGGAINSWGEGAGVFLRNGYDVLYLDYRGYGKSDGNISSEAQLIQDAQFVYDDLKKRYGESNLVLSGTSMGSGIAIQLAAHNRPHKLILNSPYASLKQLIREKVPIVPAFIIRYKLESLHYLDEVNCPMYIFHGEDDQLIPSVHASALKAAKESIKLSVLEGYGHNDLISSRAYFKKISEVLK